MNHFSLRKSWVRSAAFVLALVGAAILLRRPLVAWFGGATRDPMWNAPGSSAFAAPAGGAAHDHDAINHYTCSMHPSVKQPGPGKCPICGMALVPVTKLQHEQGVVMVDEARRQLIGVRTGVVTEGPMTRTFRAVGHVAYDEATITEVSLKVRGWITRLFVNETGQRVTKGQPLFLLYSPELFNAQQDFLLANESRRVSAGLAEADARRVGSLTKAARQRLHLLGLGDAQIDALANSGTPSESVTIPSPASGFIIEKDVVEGASVEAGMKLFRIAALDKVWIEAALYEADLAHVRAGQSATVTLDYLPGRSYETKVAYVFPSLDPATRTGRARLAVANKEHELRPGMFASVELAGDVTQRVQVPASAVVYTGPRRLVFVDLGEGRFRPQEVHVGSEANGMYEVLDGLVPGDVVATSGVFLIAAEARISTAAKYWDKASPEPGMAAPAPPLPSAIPERAQPKAPKAPAHASGSSAPATVYTCPMHPEVHSATPGKCPQCGMNLEPMPSGIAK